MRAATARAYLDGMSAEKFRAEVAPHIPARRIGQRDYYARELLDAFIRGAGADTTHGAVDGDASTAEPAPRDFIARVERDLAESKGRQARRR